MTRDGGPRDHVILYDRDCGFCKWSLDKVLFWDRRGRLRPVAIQSPEGAEHLAGMAIEERLASWHLVTPDGEIRSAADAAAPLAELLPGWRPAALLFRRFPRAVDRSYRWVADNRDRFARLLRIDASCELKRE